MAFKPNFADYHLVVAKDDKRPGWSFVWAGTPTLEEAERLRDEYAREHPDLRFVVGKKGETIP
jgi:hypothetical protein